MFKKLVHGKNKYINVIVDYLLEQCEVDDQLRQSINNEEKTLEGMWQYIRSSARKEAEDGVSMIHKETVFGLAIHYFTESDKNLGIETVKKVSKPAKNAKKKKTDNKVYEQLDLFGDF